MPRQFFGSFLLLCSLASVAAAQADTTSGRSGNDSVFARARQLVASGNGAAGRLLIDSIVAATPPGSSAYADALYWRASLATSSADAERDYRLIIVDYPVSTRVGDALFQLAQLELTRGDRKAASMHLDRFLVESPAHPERSRAGLTLVRLLFEHNELPRGCSVLRRTLAEVPSDEVETRNQLEYYSPRCAAADVNPNAQLPMPPEAPRGVRESARRDSTVPRPKAARYTLQIATYNKRSDADALAKRLKARGIDVRIVGTSKPFRVRVGQYETRAAANAAAKQLKAKRVSASVTDIEPENQ